MKRLVAFDLDGTLALSKQPIDADIAALLARLLAVAMVAVISGGDWPQFETQFVQRMTADADLSRLIIMPTTGTKLYRYQAGSWQRIYADLFSEDESKQIRQSLLKAIEQAGVAPERIWGDQIEDRGSQITFSGLGQEAPLDAKDKWDPDRKKREKIQARLQEMLPDFAINIGGATSIDVTRKGVDKGYGLKKLSEQTGVSLAEMIFIGDAVFPGGNDYPAKLVGVDTVHIRDVVETMTVVGAIIACLAGQSGLERH
jgi:HAD superfamily hydrolase (TIGR01484 family)